MEPRRTAATDSQPPPSAPGGKEEFGNRRALREVHGRDRSLWSSVGGGRGASFAVPGGAARIFCQDPAVSLGSSDRQETADERDEDAG